MSLDTLLTHRATIKRNSPVNTHGVMTPSLSTLASSVPCLVQEQLGRTTFGPDGVSIAYDAIGFFLPTQDIRPRGSASSEMPDVIECNGISYTVLHAGDEGGQGHHLTALLRRLPG